MFRFECSSGPSNEFSLHLTCLLPPCSYVDVNAAALGESAGDALGDDSGGSGEQSRSPPTPAPIATPRAVQSGPLRAASQQVRGLASLLHCRRSSTAPSHLNVSHVSSGGDCNAVCANVDVPVVDQVPCEGHSISPRRLMLVRRCDTMSTSLIASLQTFQIPAISCHATSLRTQLSQHL